MSARVFQSVNPPTAPGGLRSLTFPALGTNCLVRYAAPATEATASAFEAAAVSWVARFEMRYSRFRGDSIVSRINAAAGRSWVDIDPEAEQMLDVCQLVYRMTDGILDVTAGPLMRLWDYRKPPTRVPDQATVAAVRALVGWPKVQRAPGRVFLPLPGMSLDFGGWGKEWAVDAVAQIAATHGISQALVDFGHDIRCLGTPPDRPAWHIGLEDPDRPGTHQGSVALASGRGIASSGDYIRCFHLEGKRYGHIVDPRTGWPVANGCKQVTVVAGSCFQAGLLSTVAFVLGGERGLAYIQQQPGAEGMIATAAGRAETRGFWNHVAT